MFADLINRTGLYYNTAFFAVESNSEGRSTVDRLAFQLHYPRLYCQERIGSARRSANFDRPGWYTSGSGKGGNKGPAIANLARHIRNRSFRPHSLKLIDELGSFVYDPTARGGERYRAEQGKHDDMVMATAIGLYVRDSWQCQPIEPEPETPTTRVGRMLFQLDEEEEEAADTPWMNTG